MEEKFMRILIMFDMPTKTKEDKKNCTTFRKKLIEFGFIMLQYSVYVRICRGVASVDSHINKVQTIIPPKGHIRAITLTDKQFYSMKILLGRSNVNENANRPQELTLF